MKKHLIILTVLILFIPGFIFSDVVTFKVGYFIPRAQSDLWDIEFENMSFSKVNFQNTNFSFGYEYFLSREISLTLSIGGYTKQKSGVYLGYVGYQDYDGDWAYPDIYEGEFVPSHVYTVSITPIQVSLKLTPMGRRGRFIPYIGGGVGVYLWSVRIQGDMVDFSDEWYDTEEEVSIFPIYAVDSREDGRISIGYHVLGGIMMPIANRISVEAEFKYNILKGTFSEDEYSGFVGFEPFDLSGYQISLGINYWF